MKIFHSFWAFPIGYDKYSHNSILDVHLYVMALSVLYAKMNGLNITMHTDDFGLKFIEGMPYDDVKLSLNDIPKWMPKCLWASGKMFAQKNEPLGAVHTDYDVFIQTNECIMEIERLMKNSDAIVQSNDSMIYCEPLMERMVNTLWETGIPIAHSGESYCPSFNCGIVGFNNQRLKDEYISKYLEYTYRYSTEDVYKELLTTVKIPDLIFEQKLLYHFSQKYKIEKLLKSDFFSSDINAEAIRLGYVHLLSVSKKNRIGEVIRSLKQKDIDLYNKVEKNIALLKKEYNYD